MNQNTQQFNTPRINSFSDKPAPQKKELTAEHHAYVMKLKESGKTQRQIVPILNAQGFVNYAGSPITDPFISKFIASGGNVREFERQNNLKNILKRQRKLQRLEAKLKEVEQAKKVTQSKEITNAEAVPEIVKPVLTTKEASALSDIAQILTTKISDDLKLSIIAKLSAQWV